MAKDVVVNFKGATPITRMGRFDKIEEGTYPLRVKKATLIQTSTDRPAISVALSVRKGEYKGKTVGDMFLIPRKGTDDTNVGVQRLLGFMMICGIKRTTGKTSAKQIAKMLTGRDCIAEVADSVIPARGNYSERVTSAPQEYFAVGSKEAKAALKAAEAEASDDDEAEDEEEDEEDEEESDEEEEDEEEDEDEEEEEEEKPRRRSKKASKSTKKSKKSKKADEDEEEEDEDLYDEDEEDEDED